MKLLLCRKQKNNNCVQWKYTKKYIFFIFSCYSSPPVSLPQPPSVIVCSFFSNVLMSPSCLCLNGYIKCTRYIMADVIQYPTGSFPSTVSLSWSRVTHTWLEGSFREYCLQNCIGLVNQSNLYDVVSGEWSCQKWDCSARYRFCYTMSRVYCLLLQIDFDVERTVYILLDTDWFNRLSDLFVLIRYRACGCICWPIFLDPIGSFFTVRSLWARVQTEFHWPCPR